MKKEIFVSVDIESNGPIPGEYSMLSIGSAAFDSDGNLLGTHEANLETIPGAKEHPETMRWWARQEKAWENCRKDLKSPEQAMIGYVKWLKELPGQPVFVAYPAGFDFTFVSYYLNRFAGENPFSFSALDIKSFAMAVLGTSFKETTKKRMPKEWFSQQLKHSHVALEDAIEQGHLFINMLKSIDKPK